MALKQGDTYYMDFCFCENGNEFHRKVHEMVMQDRIGVVHRLVGRDLPNSLYVQTGMTVVGANTAQILLSPEKIKRKVAHPCETRPWPSYRDFGNFVLGLYAFLIVRFFATLLGF